VDLTNIAYFESGRYLEANVNALDSWCRARRNRIEFLWITTNSRIYDIWASVRSRAWSVEYLAPIGKRDVRLLNRACSLDALLITNKKFRREIQDGLVSQDVVHARCCRFDIMQVRDSKELHVLFGKLEQVKN
jgi:hypothetical protein